ncbi:MAG: hypothetical protein ACPHCN_14375 [Mycobacterium sp.]
MYSLRTMRRRHGSRPYCQLREDSGDTLSDFYLIGGEVRRTTGDTVAEWLTAEGATNAYVRTWYDQSGNGVDVTQATESSQPQFMPSGGDAFSTPSLDFSSNYLSASPPVTAAPFTFIGVCASHNNAANLSPFGIRNGVGGGWWFPMFGGQVGDPFACFINPGLFFAQTTSGYAEDTPVTVSGVIESPTSRSVYLNNGSVATSTDSSTPTSINSMVIGAADTGGADSMDGEICEVLLFASAAGAPTRSAVYDDQAAYYGIS